MLRGAPALKIGGDAVGVFFALWAAPLALPQLEGDQELPGAQHWRGCYRGVFATCLVTNTVLCLEGANGLPGAQHWGGCCRGVFAICVVALTLLQLEGSKARSRA